MSGRSNVRSTNRLGPRSIPSFAAAASQIPVPAELSWHVAKPELTIRSQWISFVVDFSHERMVVDAELSLAAKMFATDENRRHAVRFIESVADHLNL